MISTRTLGMTSFQMINVSLTFSNFSDFNFQVAKVNDQVSKSESEGKVHAELCCTGKLLGAWWACTQWCCQISLSPIWLLVIEKQIDVAREIKVKKISDSSFNSVSSLVFQPCHHTRESPAAHEESISKYTSGKGLMNTPWKSHSLLSMGFMSTLKLSSKNHFGFRVTSF